VRIYRIADARHPIWDGTGAALIGGRWNNPGKSVIYGSLSYSCAMLEILAHANIGRIPASHCYVIVDVPENIPAENHDESSLPTGWDSDVNTTARKFGDQWLNEKRSAIFVVPSVIAKLDRNVLVNSLHPNAHRLIVSEPKKVVWDKRLFARIDGE